VGSVKKPVDAASYPRPLWWKKYGHFGGKTTAILVEKPLVKTDRFSGSSDTQTVETVNKSATEGKKECGQKTAAQKHFFVKPI
jgi:hypothetical protein